MPSLTFSERLARLAWRIAPKRLLSAVIGWSSERRLPTKLQVGLLRLYAKAYGLDADQAELALAEYPSLQAFFVRRLKPQMRPIPSDPAVVVSPSDGRICDAGMVSQGKLLEAKGSAFTLRELLADDALAERLSGAPFLAIYLSPRDYHRVHFPAAGRVVSWTHVPGKLYPVGPGSVKRECGLFAKNERLITVVDGPAGLYAVVMVAAVGVGHITASYDPEIATHAKSFSDGKVRHKSLASPVSVQTGQELGVFNLGSTTITLFQPSHVQLDPLVSDAQIEMGRPVGRIIAK